jgi:hypothetical protein
MSEIEKWEAIFQEMEKLGFLEFNQERGWHFSFGFANELAEVVADMPIEHTHGDKENHELIDRSWEGVCRILVKRNLSEMKIQRYGEALWFILSKLGPVRGPQIRILRERLKQL